jgi:hypothetical protein
LPLARKLQTGAQIIMKKPTQILGVLLLLITTVLEIGCDAAKKAIEDASSGPLTASTLAKSWVGVCTAGSDPITSASNYIMSLTLNAGGTFTSSIAWYTGACTGGNYAVVYSSSGTFTVGGYVNGSSTMQSLNFDVTASEIMPFTTTVQTAFNTNCGGSSPFNAGGAVAGNNGGHFSTYMITCMSQVFPNSGNRSVDNVVELTAGVLSVGVFDFVIPGVYTGNTVPVSTSVYLN